MWNNGFFIELQSLLEADSGWVLTDAIDINDNEQIIGYGTYNGISSRFIMSPLIDPVQNLLLSFLLLLALVG